MLKEKWLTKQEVIEAARAGGKEALKCAVKHHEQVHKANKEQLEAFYDDARRDRLMHGSYCSLCRRYCKENTKKKCPLKNAICEPLDNCIHEWNRAEGAFKSLMFDVITLKEFRRRHKLLLDKLRKCKAGK